MVVSCRTLTEVTDGTWCENGYAAAVAGVTVCIAGVAVFERALVRLAAVVY